MTTATQEKSLKIELEEIITNCQPDVVAFNDEFRQMALELHCHHSGRSMQWDRENVEDWKDCQYLFCRRRYHLFQQLNTAPLPPKESFCSRCGKRSESASKHPNHRCLSCEVEVNDPVLLAASRRDDNPAACFGDDSDK